MFSNRLSTPSGKRASVTVKVDLHIVEYVVQATALPEY